VLSASDVNKWFVPRAVVKPSDQSKTSNTTFGNDNDLVLPVDANATYMMQMYLGYSGGTLGSSDLKIQWTVPASATLRYGIVRIQTGSSLNPGNMSRFAAADTVLLGTVVGTPQAAWAFGTLKVAGTAGNLQLQWAQNTSSATATIIEAQSALMLQQLA